ncbi:MAG: transcriptional regulator [Opitutae bacterium]|nr:transcriptional regulator [Opitutae bacterium]
MPSVAISPSHPGLVLPGGRAADVVAFEGAMVDFFVDAAELLGVPKSVAAIYGIVFASPVPLSFADIGSRLDISKGSVSQGLRVLREVGAVKEVSAAADRAELFEPDLEMRKMVQRFLENRLARQLEQGGTRLGQLAKTLPQGRNGDAAVLRARVKQLQNWNTKARALLPVVRTFLKLGG